MLAGLRANILTWDFMNKKTKVLTIKLWHSVCHIFKSWITFYVYLLGLQYIWFLVTCSVVQQFWLQ
jgi:hypothetical protein